MTKANKKTDKSRKTAVKTATKAIKKVVKKAIKVTPKKKPVVTIKAKGVNKMKSSLKIQKALAPKVTEAMLEREYERFIDLDEKQLLSRIDRLKNAVRLEVMRQIAKMCGEKKLMRIARARRNEVFA
jgi:hypothetical protein